jgi:uncharacterized membrane protein YGL010W
MRTIDRLLDEYGHSHQNSTNKLIHWICVPAIMFSLFGLLMAIPYPWELSIYWNWAAIALYFALVYYLRLSFSMFIGFAIIGSLILLGNFAIFRAVDFQNLQLVYISLGIFVIAWIGQFIGHKIEGEKPSFLKDLQFLLVGPAWLLHFIYKRIGISY